MLAGQLAKGAPEPFRSPAMDDHGPLARRIVGRQEHAVLRLDSEQAVADFDKEALAMSLGIVADTEVPVCLTVTFFTIAPVPLLR